MFLTNIVVHKKLKGKRKFSDNQFVIILRLFHVLPNFLFATSEIMGDY